MTANGELTQKGDKPQRIEDYALIGDCTTGALVGCNGSIDWLCWPRFDSEACFAALLGDSQHGRWLVAPVDHTAAVRRRYRGDTMILETEFSSEEGTVVITDFMPVGRDHSSIVRRVTGKRGRLAMRMELVLRFDYGSSMPWVTRLDSGGGISAIVGPNLAVLRTDVPLMGQDRSTIAEFTVADGESVDFVLTWGQSHLGTPIAFDAGEVLADTEAFWNAWAGKCQYKGDWQPAVLRSLLTLKALTYAPTGGIVAALTTSLPEQFGGPRNWDYRYCWLRDATLTLTALMGSGYYEEAQAWHDWLHRAVAGSPEELQIMYGIAGERRLLEWTAGWLPGYEGASPVRIGNAASEQLQLDVYGEMAHAMHVGRQNGLSASDATWPMQAHFIDYLATIWDQPDDGIWEVRGGRRQFTHSKMMVWVALDRSIKDAETLRLSAPLEKWRALRDHIHEEICDKGVDKARGVFTQSFGSVNLDASLLLMPQVGFLPADDSRVSKTIEAIESDLVEDGFVLRYKTEGGVDGLPAGEGAFLPCSFWLAQAYALQGRHGEARALFQRLTALANDVGLLSEEYSPRDRRQAGNFPQAFSHLALVAAALTINRASPEYQE